MSNLVIFLIWVVQHILGISSFLSITTVCIDKCCSKSNHPGKRFQNFCVILLINNMSCAKSG